MDNEMKDIFQAEELEITIDWRGDKVWINTEEGCVFRAYRIKKLVITDWRKSDERGGGA